MGAVARAVVGPGWSVLRIRTPGRVGGGAGEVVDVEVGVDVEVEGVDGGRGAGRR